MGGLRDDGMMFERICLSCSGIHTRVPFKIQHFSNTSFIIAKMPSVSAIIHNPQPYSPSMNKRWSFIHVALSNLLTSISPFRPHVSLFRVYTHQCTSHQAFVMAFNAFSPFYPHSPILSQLVVPSSSPTFLHLQEHHGSISYIVIRQRKPVL